MSKKYTTNFLEDTNGSTGSANQVLISTAAGIDWVDGSGSGIIGGPYLPLTAGSTVPLSGDLYINNATYIRSTDSNGAVPRTFGFNSSNNMYIGPIDSYAGGAVFYGVSANVASHTLYTGGSARMIINSTGNVGIGLTSPLNKLVVSGIDTNAELDGTTVTQAALQLSNSDEAYGTFFGTQSSGTGLIQQRRQSSATYYDLGINPYGGNVGIGTASPAKKLHILNDTDTAQIRLGQTGSGSYDIGVRTGDKFSIGRDNDTQEFTISNGNVGIGTTSPGKKLDVNGTGRFTGVLSLSDTLIMSNYQTGVVSVAQPIIKGAVFESSIETDNAVIHPYFNNDFGNFIARGGTLAFADISNSHSDASINLMFQPSNQFLGVNKLGTATTYSITMTSTNDGAFNFTYGTRLGITFGSGSFCPTSVLIECNTVADGSGTWTTALNSSASSTTYSTKLSNGATGIKAVRFTMGWNASGYNRINSIFGFNYSSAGMLHNFLGKDGGTVYGDFSNKSSTGSLINKLSLSGNSYFNGGNVGIGTTSPGAKLDVSGDILIDSGEYLSWGAVGATSIEGSTASNKLQFRTNSSDRMIINDTGVGIGTTSPDRPLSVVGGNSMVARFQSTNTTAFIQLSNTVSTADQVRIGSNGTNLVLSTNYAERMRITSAGAIKFNAYDSTNNTGTPTYLLGTDASGNVVKTNTVPGSGAGPYLPLTAGSGEALTGDLWLDDNSGASPSLYLQNGSNNYWRLLNGSTGIFSLKEGTSDRITILPGGNVGIGTTNPGQKLHINDGSVVTTTDANNMLLLTRNNHAYMMFSCPDGKDSGLHFHNTTDNSFVGRIAYDHNVSGDNMLFTVDSSEAMRITSGGNVGIGTTSPSSKLVISGGGGAISDNGFQINSGYGHSGTGVLEINPSAASHIPLSILSKNGQTANLVNVTSFGGTAGNLFNVQSSGNVGIGTTSPSAKLHVNSSDATTVQRIQGATNSALEFYNSSTKTGAILVNSTQFLIAADNSNYLNINTGGSERMRITSTGNVGIGVTGPAQKLHVSDGGIRVEKFATGLGGFISVGNATESVGNYSAYFFGNTASDTGYFKGGIAYETLASTYGRGDMHFLQNSTTAVANATISDSVMTILNGGNVGIGTTSPSTKLHVAGTGLFTGLVSGITPVAAANFVTKAYVDAAVVTDINQTDIWFQFPGTAGTTSGRSDGWFSGKTLKYTNFQANFDNLTLESGSTYKLILERFKKGQGDSYGRSSTRKSGYKRQLTGTGSYAGTPYNARPVEIAITSLSQNFDFRPDLYYSASTIGGFPRPSGFSAPSSARVSSRQYFTFRISKTTSGVTEVSNVLAKLQLVGDNANNQYRITWKPYQ